MGQVVDEAKCDVDAKAVAEAEAEAGPGPELAIEESLAGVAAVAAVEAVETEVVGANAGAGPSVEVDAIDEAWT
jgi:hypothetical protein